MSNRILTIFAAVAVGAIATPAAAQLFQSQPQGVYRDPGYPPGGYRADDPRLATGAIGDADDDLDPRNGPVYSDRVAPPAPVNGLEDSRYSRTYGGATPAPVTSPDDPRYGRLGPPPAVIYSDRPGPAPRDYSDRSYDDPYAGGVRPPQALGGSAPAAAPQQQGGPAPGPVQLSALPPEERPETGPVDLAPRFRRQEVNFATKEPAGTIVVDTANTYLYYVLGNGRAVRYGIRVGRDGFTWNGTQKITRKAEWPDWHPPAEMIERQPYLPRFMAGGEGNPLGARAMYLGNTVYRIHGTNQPSTIGKQVSSGCFGMLNDDVADLFERVKVGTRVVVMPGTPSPSVAAAAPSQAMSPQANAAPLPPAPLPGAQPTQVAPLPPPASIR